MIIIICFYFIFSKSSLSKHVVIPNVISSSTSYVQDSLEIKKTDHNLDIVYFIYTYFMTEKESVKSLMAKSYETFGEKKHVFNKKEHIKGVFKQFALTQLKFLIDSEFFDIEMKENWDRSSDTNTSIYKQITKVILNYCPNLFESYNFYEILFKDEVYKVSSLLGSFILVKSFKQNNIYQIHKKIFKKDDGVLEKIKYEKFIENTKPNVVTELLMMAIYSKSWYENVNYMPIKKSKYRIKNVEYTEFTVDMNIWKLMISGCCGYLINKKQKINFLILKKPVDQIYNYMRNFDHKIVIEIKNHNEYVFESKKIDSISKEEIEELIKKKK